ncbi:TPA: hypothetical protein DCY43_01485 [candidate division WWE3 bacterium]|uniref:DUF2283 domain-containing protein n=4 Tax=Katanobacteria TaxID=422282 RepID=A0A0G1KHQ9_UNCKA|nr:MAG: hypothetical protein UW36_C0002G0055 [candidate division WWE3 bacterium GW2011_GWA2_44_16]KKT83040.1 MAG: hypothetical protein UW82_C0049G0007 [candidate division WWE3 bacterium GW2011_GWC2_44_9]OGC51309.1 MAG: hypothetical protein A2709_01220 [candidate division WWE3 bacterium RIFCSPHIGHO2_01_FULL_43_9]HAZ29411.1 hypothetical protein [candidate division WWE3 bacterium]
MAEIEFLLDPIGNTLNMWWKNPKSVSYSEESDTSNDVIIYDKNGVPIGVEILGLFPNELNMSKALGRKETLKLIATTNGKPMDYKPKKHAVRR